MIRKILALIVFIGTLFPLSAQNISLFGTAKANLSLDYYDQDSLLYDSIMGEHYLDNYLLLNTQAVLSGSTTAFIKLNTDLLIQEIIESQSDQVEQTVTFTISEAYLSILLTDFLFFTLGKKRLVWGTGLSYNPSDFINPPKDPSLRTTR